VLTRLRHVTFLGFLVVCLLTVSWSANAEPRSMPSLVEDIARQFAAALPADARLATLGVSTILGDPDGRIAHGLTGALAAARRARIIERHDLQALLREQGLQVRDWVDPQSRVGFGRISGVQGLVLGEVVAADRGWVRDGLRIRLKVADVERGRIILAREFVATRWRAGPVTALALVFGGLGGSVFAVAGRYRALTRERVLARTDVRERRLSGSGLGAAMAELGHARSVLYGLRFEPEAIRIRDLELDVRTLRDRLASGPVAMNQGERGADFYGRLAVNQGVRALAADLTRATSALCGEARAGDRAQIQRALDEIAAETRSVERAVRGSGV
jgi:hypothetical protein